MSDENQPRFEVKPLTTDVAIFIYGRDGHTYVWLFVAGLENEARQAVGLLAGDNETAFDWDDAAFVTQRMRQMELERELQIEADKRQES